MIEEPLQKKAACLRVELHGITLNRSTRRSTRRLTESSDVKLSDAEPELLRIQARVLDSPEYAAIEKINRQVDREVSLRALDAPFERGWYLIPFQHISSTISKLDELLGKRQAAVELFIAQLPRRVQETRSRLGGLAVEFPVIPTDDIRHRLRHRYYFRAFSVPGELQDISPELFEAEKQKAVQQAQEYREALQEGLREGMLELVNKLQEALRPDAQGNTKRFHSSTVDNLNEFLRFFDGKNTIANSPELAQLAEAARNSLAGKTSKGLKGSQESRQELSTKLRDISMSLQELTTKRPERVLRFL